MGQKVDISEVIELSEDLNTATADIKSNLTSISESIDKLNALSSFSGLTAKEAKNYFSDLHQTVLKTFDHLFTDLDEHLKQHLQSFESRVDKSQSAIIESDYLMDTEGDVNDDYDLLSEEKDSIRETISNVSDITSASTPSGWTLDSDHRTTIDTINNLEEDLESYTSKGYDEISEIEDILHHIEKTIKNAGAVSGEARFTDYKGSSTTVGLSFLKEHFKNDISDRAIQIDNLDDEASIIYEKAKEDYENGEIDKSVFDSIEGILASSGGSTFLNNSIQKKISDEVSDKVASNIYEWVKKNTPHFMNRAPGMVTSLGNVVSTTEPPSTFTNLVRTGARYGGSIVGTAIDFGTQVIQGENVADASVKAVSHTAIGITGAKIGASVGSIIPFGGTAVGAVVGFSLGVLGSMAFDSFYDDIKNVGTSVIENVKETGEKIGDAVSGFFGNLGSVFG